MLKVKSNVVNEVASKMQEFMIQDLISATKEDLETSPENTVVIPHFSKEVEDFFISAKKINYKYFVPATNWEYQFNELPEAVEKLTKKCAEGLIKSGAIRDKFYDENVRRFVKYPGALKHMKTTYRSEEQYDSYREEKQIRSLKPHAKTRKGRMIGSKKRRAVTQLSRSVYKYVENQEEVFAMRYEHTYLAIEKRIKERVKLATESKKTISEERKDRASKKEEKIKADRNYGRQRRKLINKTRKEILKKYKTINITDEQREEFIRAKIEEELQTMEEKMAIQLASDYLAGMSDVSFNEMAIKTGCIKRNTILKSVRTKIGGENASKLAEKMITESDEGR